MPATTTASIVNRASSNVPRARFTVDEVVKLTIDFYRRNDIEGLFLSSGIIRSLATSLGTRRCRSSFSEITGRNTPPWRAQDLPSDSNRSPGNSDLDFNA